MSDSNTLGIADYLEKEGVEGILARLDAQEGLLNHELDDCIHISHTTLSDCLKEGVEKDLLIETRNPDDHGNAKRYLLTKRGMEIKRKMESLGMVEAYDQFFEAYQKLENGGDSIQEWVADSEIDDPRWPPDHDAADGKKP